MAGQTPTVAVGYGRHPAALLPSLLATSRAARFAQPKAIPAVAPWSPLARFAPPSPAWVSLATLDAQPRPTGLNVPAVADGEESTPPETQPAPAVPPPLPGPPSRWRPESWTPETGGGQLWAIAPMGAPPPRNWRTRLWIPAGAALAIAAAAAAVWLAPCKPIIEGSASGVFNAPVIVLRARHAGRVTNVAVKPGQTVGPDTLLLTIRSTTPSFVGDRPVLAEVHGVVRSLEVEAGVDAVAGLPLVRLLDCDHAFLTVAADKGLRAGEAVRVQVTGLPPVAATVRTSSGVAEPPDDLVIPMDALPARTACPVGANATIVPIQPAAPAISPNTGKST